MSAELPSVSADHVNSRLEQLEQRLEQAKKARDNYIEFLKQNKVANNSNGQEHQQMAQSISNQRPSLMRRLETSQHFWNFQNQPESYSLTPLPTTDPVPRGMVLNSDLNSMTKRLREIGSSIRNLRDYRLSMPSDEYFRSVRPHLQNNPNHSQYYGDPVKADLPSLAEIRSRILSMQFNVEKRTRELIDQKNQLIGASQPNLANISLGQQIVSQPNPIKQPEWLRQKEALEEELKKMSENHLKSEKSQMETIQKRELQKVVDSIPNQTKEPELKVEEKPLTISSNRQILFGDLKPSVKSEVDVKLADSKDQYNRMLDILRPKPVEVSSSDDDELGGVAASRLQVAVGQQQPKTPNTPSVLTNNEFPQPAKPLPSFLQTPTSNLFSTPTISQQKPPLTQSLAKSSNLSDSDSDFFK